MAFIAAQDLNSTPLPVVTLPTSGEYVFGDANDDTKTPPSGTKMVRITAVAGSAWVALTATLASIPAVPPGANDADFPVEYIPTGAKFEFAFLGDGVKTFQFSSNDTASVIIAYYGDTGSII